MLSCTFSMFWTTVTSQTSSEKRRTNRHTVKPTVMFGSRAGFAKGSHTLPCFHKSGPSAERSSTHRGFSNLSHMKKALCSACTHCSISPQSRGVNRCSCSHPQKARLPMSLSSVGMTTSWSATQLRKTSLPICVSRGGSHMQFKATQWAKVE